MSKLKNLLETPQIPDPHGWFEQVCRELFWKHVLVIEKEGGGSARFHIKEAELYLKSEEHPDIFTHCDKDQNDPGEWYFHKRGRGYKEGNYGGLDITFGNENRFGGILVRQIKNLETGELFDGPGTLTREIRRLLKVEKMAELAKVVERDIFMSKNMILKEHEFEEDKIYKAPRKGLSLVKNVQERAPFITRYYRYFAGFPKTNKAKPVVVTALWKQGVDPVEHNFIKNKKILEGYLELFEKGLDFDPKKTYKKEKDNSFFIIKMMGELERRGICLP